MRRLLQILSVLSMLFVCGAATLSAAAFIITGDDPLTAARGVILRLALSTREDDLNNPYGPDDSPVRFEVPSGTTPSQIATNLQAQQLITDPMLFINYTIVNSIDSELEAGTYFLSQNMTIIEIANRLTDSNSSQLPFRILEGWRKEEIADAIDRNELFGFSGAEFLAVVGPSAQVPPEFAAFASLPPDASLEGFLYPDFYLLPPSVTPTGLRDILLDTFRERVADDLLTQAAAQNLTLYDVVTLASISEREAVHAEEHPQIISVYRNRLDAGMRLDADPTVQYALNNTRGSWWAQITRADYAEVNSPYNTYLYAGLPPGPIANPGIASMRAAISPAETDYYYFRAFCDNSGYHEFAVTYEEHLQNGCTG